MRMFLHPLRPLSSVGRALLAVLVSVFATLLLVGWPPAHADDSRGAQGREPVLRGREQRPRHRPPAAEVAPRSTCASPASIADVTRDAALPQRRPARRSRRATCSPARRRPAVHAMSVRLGDRVLTAQHPREAAARASNTTTAKKRRQDEPRCSSRSGRTCSDERRQHPARRRGARSSCTTPSCCTPTDAVYGFVFPTVVGPALPRRRSAGRREAAVAGAATCAPGRARRAPRST